MPAGAGPISIRVRFVPRFTGNPTVQTVLFCAEGFGAFNTNTIWLYLDATSKLNFLIKDQYGTTTYVNVQSSAISPTLTSGTPVDMMVTWDGTTTANKVRFSMDGAQISTHTATTAANSTNLDRNLIDYIMVGGSTRFTVANIDLNELEVYDTEESHTYTVRTGFTTDTAFDGGTYTDPGIANVRSGTSYTYAGSTLTGTAAIPVAANVRSGTATDATTGTLVVPTAAQVKTGVSFDTASTGTYDGSDRWTDPGIANVRSATAYKANSTSNNRTGTAAIPVAGDVRSGVSTDATTGTVVIPTAAQVKTGVSFDTASTGTYDGSDRWTDVGIANVRSGSVYKANSTSNNRTGTLVVPDPQDVRYGTSTDATTGTAHIPSRLDVRRGTAVENTTGTAYIPAASDVRSGVSVDAGAGTLVVPSTGNVKVGVSFDNSSTGTYDGSDLWSDPGVTHVRRAVAYRANSVTNNRTGTADIPGAADVRYGTATDATTGTLAVPSPNDVRSGISVDASTGNMGIPSDGDVRLGVHFDTNNAAFGRLDLPAESAVHEGVTFDQGTKTGTSHPPDQSDVRAGVAYGAIEFGEYTGTLDLPTEANVKHGIDFDGASSTGTYRGYDLWEAVVAEELINTRTIMQDGVSVTGLVSPAQILNFRAKLDAILQFITVATLTDDEFDTITITDDSDKIATYNALLSVLNSRETVSGAKERLLKFYQARNISVIDQQEPTVSTRILIGGDLSETISPDDLGKSNVFVGGEL